jgi:glucan biosynthesis protein C
LHQTLIIIIGYYVIQWNIPVAAKYIFVVVAVFLSALVIYEVVRRINVTRFLFGIKVRKSSVSRK